MRILVINPGSTSTKWAVYDDRKLIWKETKSHSVDQLKQFIHVYDQLDMRRQATIEALQQAGIDMKFDAIIARGGLVRPTPSGVYNVDSKLIEDLRNSELEHACNLGGLIAADIAHQIGCPAYIADPEVVDEMMPEAKITGIRMIRRRSIFHALNTKAVARRYAWSIGRRYEDLNLILVHLGGGISVGAHRKGKVIDVNNALNGDGPFSPERAGTIPSDQLVDMCFSGRYTQREIKQMLNGKGGLSSLVNSTDVALIAKKASHGREPYRLALDAMMYSVAKEVGSRSVALRGKVDAIIVTGGIAHSEYCVKKLRHWIDWIGPVVVRAGEDELDSLAFNAYGVLTGSIPITKYYPDE
ncbi:MAG: butyrate kinase [Bacteroides sp.]|nr:butyrate kinase [Bacteroides sp.]MCM1414187.1 butyrate kinase [Bacteroides sp.]MCM1472009.1 butyrate kinase [Bacteroides sp.]